MVPAVGASFFLLGSGFVLLLLAWSPRFDRLQQRIATWGSHRVAAVLWFVLFVLHLTINFYDKAYWTS